MNWTGVLESHHGLYSRLLLMYFGAPKVVKPSRGQADTEAAPISDDEDGMQHWKQALMDELSSAPADPQDVPAVHADGAGPEAAPEVDLARASLDNEDLWKEMKQMRRQSATGLCCFQALQQAVRHERDTWASPCVHVTDLKEKRWPVGEQRSCETSSWRTTYIPTVGSSTAAKCPADND